MTSKRQNTSDVMHESRLTSPCKTTFPDFVRIHGNSGRVYKNTKPINMTKNGTKSANRPAANLAYLAPPRTISYGCQVVHLDQVNEKFGLCETWQPMIQIDFSQYT